MGKRSLNGLIATVIGVVMILMYQDHLPEAGAYDQQASQPTKGLQTNLYHWLDGEYDRLLYLVRMDYTSDPPAPVFRRSPDGPDMVLPGGVTLILGNSWTDVNARRLFEKHKVPHNRVEKLPNMNGAYYIHTEPGFPSLNLANKMAKNGDVVAATPTWRGGTLALTQQPTDQEQSSDHHGDSHEDATQLDLIQTFTGTIEPGDKDYFSITLSNEQAGTYIFYPRATESILGGKYLIAELVDGDGRCLQRQCNLPGRSPKVKLQSGANYFRIRPVDTLTEGAGYHLYLIREEPYDRWMQECAAIQSKYEDPLYGCQWHLKNTEFNGRLKSPRAVGSDINVEPVWDAGILGEGIRIQIVDTGMDSRHEDLVDNVDRASNYKIGSQQGWGQPVLNLNNWHGVEMAGLIAARDNDKGIRGVAPRATIFMEDSLGRPASVNSHTVMRGKDISAISSNSWVISNSWSNTGSPTLITQSADYRSAVEDAVNSGFGGKGVFFSTGSGAYSSKGKGTTNTSEREAHYALTAVCVVGEDGAQVERLNRRSPWGYTNWVCSPGEGATTGNFDSYVRGVAPPLPQQPRSYLG